MGFPVAAMASINGVFEISPRPLSRPACRSAQNLQGLEREWRREKYQPSVSRVLCQARPLFCREFHTLPIVVTRSVLIGEFNAERLQGHGLSSGNMGLKFDGIGAYLAREIDEGMGKAERTVMRLRDLGDEEGGNSPRPSDPQCGCRAASWQGVSLIHRMAR